jgi:site-specific recombinase XerD
MRRISETEIEKLILLARKSSLRDAVMICLSYFHGMRAAEICELRVADVSLATGSIVIRRKKGSLTTTQCLHVHKVKPHLDERKMLTQWIEESDADKREFLFDTQKAGRMNPRSWWRLFRGYCQAAGIDPALAHPHSIKHATATFLLRQGADLATVRQHLGHKSYQSTFRYLGVDDQQASERAQALFSRM